MRLVSDRWFFLQLLRTRPQVLARHLPCLSEAVLKKLANRLKSAVRPPHAGAKGRPYWIDGVRPGKKPGTLESTGIFLPKWALGREAGAVSGQASVCPQSDADDAEVRFERNRWRFLCEKLWVPCSDWQHSLSEVRSWIALNRDRDEEAWEPYSASERVANLLVWLACVDNAKGDAWTSVEDLKLFVEESLDWIAGHLEYYGERGTNNHTLNNARALVMGGVAVGDDWSFRAGMRTFNEFLPRLVAKGGFLRERSSHYQLIVANWVLDAWCFVDARFGNADPDAMFLKEYALRMVAAAATLCDERGDLLGLVGDVSPDASPELTSRRLALLYPDIWNASPTRVTDRKLISDDWFRLDDGSQSVLGNFPSGSFPPSYPTHGHGDHTGFVWCVGDVPVLVDSGRYRYTPDGVSAMQKGALGHSVPLVNGFPPLCESLLRNGLWWPRPYAAATLDLSVDGECVRMSHDGFARATPVRFHARRLCTLTAGIKVEDQFDGAGAVAVQLRWNFGPGFEVFDLENCSVSGADGVVHLSVAGFQEAPVFRVRRADDSGGWYSKMYGMKTPSLVLEVEGRISMPASIMTEFEIVHVRNRRNPAL